MHENLLDILRCPFCGTSLSLVDNGALRRQGDIVVDGVIGCECCAYPVVDGIPVLITDDRTRYAMHALEDGRRSDALLALLEISDPERRRRFTELLAGGRPTYREALALLCDDAEGTWFLHRLGDPGFIAIEALIEVLGRQGWPFDGRVLDLCGGSGHLTRVLGAQRDTERAEPTGTVLADLGFWKLWLGVRFVAPGAAAICCDANNPLPFDRDTFRTVFLADAFPYVWHKRLLADEMMRLVGSDGLVVMPHLHSALGDNFSAGDTLTPMAYQGLFAPIGSRLFSDDQLFDDVIGRRVVDLAANKAPAEFESVPSLTLIAGARPELFRVHDVPRRSGILGALVVNPLYAVERAHGASTLTLSFPTEEYEAEFAACRRYLPEMVTVASELTPPLDRASVGPQYDYLIDHRVLIDAPVGY